MTNEIATIITNAPEVIAAAQHIAQTYTAWNPYHMAVSGAGSVALWKFVEHQLPSWFNTVENYCNTHDGGVVEVLFHKLFGKPIPPKQP